MTLNKIFNFYSVLYYNSEIWHLPSLKATLKQKLMSVSTLALKTCTKFNNQEISYHQYHIYNNRATPEKYLIYKHAILLFKLYKDTSNSLEWVALNFNQMLTSCSQLFNILKDNKLKLGLNALANRLHVLNNKLPLS